MANRSQSDPIERARDELFSHILRCGVLDAQMKDRVQWLDDTMSYMSQRHPDLSEMQLARLQIMGRQFIKPAIPHGAHATALNRGDHAPPRPDWPTPPPEHEIDRSRQAH